MTDNEILPINREDLEEEPPKVPPSQANAEPLKEDKELPPIPEEDEESEEEVEVDEKPKKEIFEKPELKMEISPRTGKPKRKLSEKQLENLAKARLKSQAKRKALKEAGEMERMKKAEIRKQKRDAKLEKQEEQDAILSMKAKIQIEAEKNATWDEARLQGLIDRSIDNYIEKKKKQKPVPKVHIPAQTVYPQLPPQAQPVPNQGYYNNLTQPQYYQNPNQYIKTNKPRNSNNPLETLFGTFHTD